MSTIPPQTNESIPKDDEDSPICVHAQKDYSVKGNRSTDKLYEQQHELTLKANKTFHELCKTLENEQYKLIELEERRKKLQEEMLQLKTEIEEEKRLFSLNIVNSVAENLNTLNNNNNNNSDNNEDEGKNYGGNCFNHIEVDNEISRFNKDLYTCYEDEELPCTTARTICDKKSQEFIQEEDTATIQEHVQHIRSELQNVLSECLTQQYEEKE